jgi:hypothetical protein
MATVFGAKVKGKDVLKTVSDWSDLSDESDKAVRNDLANGLSVVRVRQD